MPKKMTPEQAAEAGFKKKQELIRKQAAAKKKKAPKTSKGKK